MAKRALDLGLLLPVLPVYTLLFSLVALLVLLLDGRPVFFIQRRAGKGRRPFAILKLRTMTTEADPSARRPTRLGGFLRRRGLDELPQLLNVLLGQMSLVGPRPLSVDDAERLVAAHPPFAARFTLPPGLTGPAQVLNLRGVERTAEVEAAYAHNRSAFGDVRILMRTAWINLVGKPAAKGGATRLLLVLSLPILGWLWTSFELERLRHLKDSGGPAAFSTLDLLSISALNTVMAVGGYALGFSEVARETLLLFVPTTPAERSFQSSFAMRSPAVRAAAARLAERVAKGETRAQETVFLDADPLAVRLAFSSPLELIAQPGLDAGCGIAGPCHLWTGKWIELTAQTSIVYPRRAVIPLWPGPTGRPVLFDEGIFWVLQERGWFFPYRADWTWTVPTAELRGAVRSRDHIADHTVGELATLAAWRAFASLER